MRIGRDFFVTEFMVIVNATLLSSLWLNVVTRRRPRVTWLIGQQQWRLPSRHISVHESTHHLDTKREPP